MSSIFEKFLAKEAKSLARSLLQSNAKKSINGILSKFQLKSPATIQQEINRKLGYITKNYTVDKNQKIIFKSSILFFREWLANSHLIKEKLIKDEETGFIYYDGVKINNEIKLGIIEKFIDQTGINTNSALHSHFEGALKLLDVNDYTGILFRNTFKGWLPTNESVIDTFLPKLFGSALETDAKYAGFLFRKWIVGAAKRAIEPGVSFDGCLVLQGVSGVGKTAMFRELLPAPFDNRTGEFLGNIKNPQKFVEGTIGKTICCFDELSALDAPKVNETFKQLLSSRFIDVRLPWRKNAERFLLRTAFSATTNKEKFIKDKSLSRRLWVIKLNNSSRIDFDYLKYVRYKLWQEALYLATNGEDYLLSVNEQKILENNNLEFLA